MTPDPYPDGMAPPWTPTGLADPYPWFAAMIEHRPVAHDPEQDVWHIFRYADVRTFLSDSRGWSTARRLDHVPVAHRTVRLLTTDPPEHTRLRQMFAHAYRPARIADLTTAVRRACRALLADNMDRGRFDVVADFAAPLTSTMICQILGVPSTDNEELQRRFKVVLSGVGDQGTDGPRLYMGGTPPDENEAVNQLFERLIAQRRRQPADDLISDLVSGSRSGRGTDVDLTALLNEQRNAGQNTTVHLIASMVLLLCRHPDQLARLRHHPELAIRAVEETARYSSPLQARPRIATRKMTVRDSTIPEGATCLAWLQAANLDPDLFSDPLVFDVARWPNPHLAFGFGDHFCLGSKLGRIEAVIAIEELLRQTKDLGLADDGPPRWLSDFVLRGLDRLMVEVVPA